MFNFSKPDTNPRLVVVMCNDSLGKCTTETTSVRNRCMGTRHRTWTVSYQSPHRCVAREGRAKQPSSWAIPAMASFTSA